MGLRAHARHPMQTKGVLLPLGQQPDRKLVLCAFRELALMEAEAAVQRD